MIVFVTKQVYDVYSVGNKLTIQYEVYKNDGDQEFILTTSVSEGNRKMYGFENKYLTRG